MPFSYSFTCVDNVLLFFLFYNHNYCHCAERKSNTFFPVKTDQLSLCGDKMRTCTIYLLKNWEEDNHCTLYEHHLLRSPLLFGKHVPKQTGKTLHLFANRSHQIKHGLPKPNYITNKCWERGRDKP